jgi:hypothetical protein
LETIVSDNHLRLIPTDPDWQPDAEAAQRAARVLSILAPDAESVEVHLYPEVTFIDQGSNFESVSCPACQTPLEMEWWASRMGEMSDSQFTNLTVITPCCDTTTSLNDLTYDWPAGFAKAELSAVNPQRGWLTESELDQLTSAIGHALRQVMTHY